MATRRVTIVRVDAKLAWEVRRYQDGDWLAICDQIGRAHV